MYAYAVRCVCLILNISPESRAESCKQIGDDAWRDRKAEHVLFDKYEVNHCCPHPPSIFGPFKCSQVFPHFTCLCSVTGDFFCSGLKRNNFEFSAKINVAIEMKYRLSFEADFIDILKGYSELSVTINSIPSHSWPTEMRLYNALGMKMLVHRNMNTLFIFSIALILTND